MTKFRSTSRRAVAAAVAVTASLWLTGAATPAAAEDPHSAMSSQYSSLSASLVGLYATKSNQTVGDFLAAEQLLLKPADMTMPDPVTPTPSGSTTPGATPTLPATPGASVPATPVLPGSSETPTAGSSTTPQLGTMTFDDFPAIDVSSVSASGGLLLTADQLGSITGQAVPVTATDMASLTSQLNANGLTLPTSGYTSLSSLATKVSKAAKTPDGAVTIASAKWADELSKLRAPKLKGATTKATSPGLPADALPFGLLMNKSLTTMITDHPNMIAAAQNENGLGSPELAAAWNQSMAKAYSQSSTELTSLLPNPCVGAMMGVMATGKATKSSGGCAPSCVVAGQYLHQQAGAAFEPGRNSLSPNVSNPAGGVLNHSTFTNMSSWAQGMIGSQNPTLIGPGAVASPGNGPSDCASASSATKNTLGTKLPGLFASLK